MFPRAPSLPCCVGVTPGLVTHWEDSELSMCSYPRLCFITVKGHTANSGEEKAEGQSLEDTGCGPLCVEPPGHT